MFKLTVAIKHHLFTLEHFMKPPFSWVQCYFQHVCAFSQPSSWRSFMYVIWKCCWFYTCNVLTWDVPPNFHRVTVKSYWKTCWQNLVYGQVIYALDGTTGYKNCLIKKQLRQLKLESWDCGFIFSWAWYAVNQIGSKTTEVSKFFFFIK
jgi:hypothetical protein